MVQIKPWKCQHCRLHYCCEEHQRAAGTLGHSKSCGSSSSPPTLALIETLSTTCLVASAREFGQSSPDLATTYLICLEKARTGSAPAWAPWRSLCIEACLGMLHAHCSVWWLAEMAAVMLGNLMLEASLEQANGKFVAQVLEAMCAHPIERSIVACRRKVVACMHRDAIPATRVQVHLQLSVTPHVPTIHHIHHTHHTHLRRSASQFLLRCPMLASLTNRRRAASHSQPLAYDLPTRPARATQQSELTEEAHQRIHWSRCAASHGTALAHTSSVGRL